MPTPIEMLVDRDAIWTAEADGPPEDWDGVTPYAIKEGVLNIPMIGEIPCAVLNTGQRVFFGPLVEEMVEGARKLGLKADSVKVILK